MTGKIVICQCCGKEIKAGDKVVKVERGVLGFSAHPHARVDGPDYSSDYFHAGCDIAVRGA